jgi:aspartyl aminopeptidase
MIPFKGVLISCEILFKNSDFNLSLSSALFFAEIRSVSALFRAETSIIDKMAIPESFMISADGSYAVHPNREDKNDPTNICIMNQGITIKTSAGRNYATDTETSAIFKQLCSEVDIPVQHFVNHSDMRGGKSIGSIVESLIGVKGVDIGPPMLAMHSAMEYVGTDDLLDCYKIFKHFYDK